MLRLWIFSNESIDYGKCLVGRYLIQLIAIGIVVEALYPQILCIFRERTNRKSLIKLIQVALRRHEIPELIIAVSPIKLNSIVLCRTTCGYGKRFKHFRRFRILLVFKELESRFVLCVDVIALKHQVILSFT